MDFTKLISRDYLGQFLNENNLLGEGLEVGVLSGENARNIISKWNGKMLHLLDPWETQPDNVYCEPTNHTDWSEAYRSCVALAKEYEPRVNLIRGYSPEASLQFADGQLDWFYLDGNHSLEAVRKDLRAWWPKVKSGGIFAGHDTRNQHNETQCCD